MRTLRNKKF